MLQSKKSKQLNKIFLKEQLQGWTLTEILPEQVIFKKDSRISKLELVVTSSPKLSGTGEKRERSTKGKDEHIPPLPDEKDLKNRDMGMGDRESADRTR